MKLFICCILTAFCMNLYATDNRNGMREWVESLPTKSISMVNLFMNYTIIGL